MDPDARNPSTTQATAPPSGFHPTDGGFSLADLGIRIHLNENVPDDEIWMAGKPDCYVMQMQDGSERLQFVKKPKMVRCKITAE